MPRLLKEALKNIFTEEELSQLYAAFDVIGDICVLKIPDSLLPKSRVIAETILKELKYIKTVVRQSAPVAGEYRVRGVEYLAGEPKTVTLHKEHGCLYKVDIAKVFFSPRLATERLRIASQVKAAEIVANLFAGVGPFSILIAKRQPRVTVYSVEPNPLAYHLMEENIGLNRVEDRVVPLQGDSRELVVRELHKACDRVLMPHPEEARRFLETALNALKPEGGLVHYYTFSRGGGGAEAALREVSSHLSARHHIIGAKVVREIGTRVQEVVVDIRIEA